MNAQVQEVMQGRPHEVLYSRESGGPRVEILGPYVERADEVLTPLALRLLASLHGRFNQRRLDLLDARARRQREFDAGVMPGFLTPTTGIRAGDWRAPPVPHDLRDQRLVISGPVDPKSVINALNTPVRAFAADFEDSCAPTWSNLVGGQVNLADAVRRKLTFADSTTGKVYRMRDQTATVVVRPRGWHLPEKHVRIDGAAVSATLFDFALYIAGNHEVLRQRGSGPYFYLPKLESHFEARLWNDVFLATQEALDLPRGTIKAIVLIETIPAAFAMDEIVHELGEHVAGLNFGRWDHSFSFIKTLRERAEFVLPDRAATDFQRRTLDLLAQTSRRRFGNSGEIDWLPLLGKPEGQCTEAGMRNAIRVAVLYLESWLRGSGCVSVDGVVEDTASAEICRAQLWQWLRHGVRTSDGRAVTAERFDRLLMEELDRIHHEVGFSRLSGGVFPTATRLLERMTKQDTLDEFMTLPAYELLS